MLHNLFFVQLFAVHLFSELYIVFRSCHVCSVATCKCQTPSSHCQNPTAKAIPPTFVLSPFSLLPLLGWTVWSVLSPGAARPPTPPPPSRPHRPSCAVCDGANRWAPFIVLSVLPSRPPVSIPSSSSSRHHTLEP
ncbi:hypothetical protein HanRHA438_Chr10g0468121 [Helianthus annuus]|nr:hypothetical protein HanIR_Chr10g0490821 [Helianthus annuus]KAJ0880878.1 hypothetical protein HanRHA438_Chr10g0468121 [Helianthus annuus]